ncbi:hypothetical protein WI99_15075 [Burkholderia cepacia]|nr:hypothetical protein WI99_15075 [Burkholderia cepacia]
MDGFPAEQGVHRYAVVTAEQLDFLNTHASYALLDGYKSGAGNADDLGRIFLPNGCVLSCYSQATSNFLCSQLI